MYSCIQSVAAAAAATSLCVAILLLLLQLLLLAAAVRHRVPDGVIFCLFIASDSCVFFPFHPIRFIFTAPLGSIVAFMSSIGLYYVLGNYGQWRSQGRRQSAPAKPHL